MKFNSPMFVLTLMLGTIITVSSTSWISMWMGLEINLMALIPLIKTKKAESSDSMMIYFLVQSMSSMILLFMVLMNSLTMENPAMVTGTINMAMGMSLLIKMGAPPMHMWLPLMMNKMEWTSCILLMTWQKIAPMSVMSHLIENNYLMTGIIMMSTMIGAIGGLNQTSLRKILAYSSINHLGWMMALMMFSSMWMMYLMIYSIMIVLMCSMFKNSNTYSLSQMTSSMSIQEKIVNSINLMSLGGLPPFIGFLPKWITISTLIENNIVMMTTFMCFMSLVTLFYYMRVISPIIMFNYQMNKWSIKKSEYKINKMLIMNLALPVFLILNFS